MFIEALRPHQFRTNVRDELTIDDTPMQNPVARPVRRSDLAGQKVHHRGETKISGDIGGTKMHTHEKINGRDPGIIVHIFWGTFSRHGCGTKPTCSISCDACSAYAHGIRYPCFVHGMRHSEEGIRYCRMLNYLDAVLAVVLVHMIPVTLHVSCDKS